VFFTILGLILAMLFGMFFGSEGDLSPDVQDSTFFGLIVAGVSLHALQILYRSLCRRRAWWICRYPWLNRKTVT